MDDITVEKKMQLVQQIRSQHNRNQYDLSARERILHGYSVDFTSPVGSDEKSTSESLKFRSALAVMLLLFSILFDYFKIAPVGIEMNQIFQMIAADYQKNVSEYVETMTRESVSNSPSQ